MIGEGIRWLSIYPKSYVTVGPDILLDWADEVSLTWWGSCIVVAITLEFASEMCDCELPHFIGKFIIITDSCEAP